MSYELEFCEIDGRAPVRDWLDRISVEKRAAALRALSLILGSLGPAVADSEFGKALGGGLYEFRIRHSAREIVERFRPDGASRLGPFPDDRVLLRVFFHPHGDRVILLLGAYDKGVDSSARRQQREIRTARARLRAWQHAHDAKHSRERSFRLWWIRQVRRPH